MTWLATTRPAPITSLPALVHGNLLGALVDDDDCLRSATSSGAFVRIGPRSLAGYIYSTYRRPHRRRIAALLSPVWPGTSAYSATAFGAAQIVERAFAAWRASTSIGPELVAIRAIPELDDWCNHLVRTIAAMRRSVQEQLPGPRACTALREAIALGVVEDHPDLWRRNTAVPVVWTSAMAESLAAVGRMSDWVTHTDAEGGPGEFLLRRDRPLTTTSARAPEPSRAERDTLREVGQVPINRTVGSSWIFDRSTRTNHNRARDRQVADAVADFLEGRTAQPARSPVAAAAPSTSVEAPNHAARVDAVRQGLAALNEEWLAYLIDPEQVFLTMPRLRDDAWPATRTYREAMAVLGGRVEELHPDVAITAVEAAELALAAAEDAWSAARLSAAEACLTALPPREQAALRRAHHHLAMLENPNLIGTLRDEHLRQLRSELDKLDTVPISWDRVQSMPQLAHIDRAALPAPA